MIATLNIASLTQAYADNPGSSNPIMRYVDWTISQNSISVNNPKSTPYTVAPGATLAVFNNARATSIDNTTEFQLTLSSIPGATTRYRFTWTATGTAPAFRVDRGITLSGHAVTMTAQTNSTLSMAATAGDFTAVVVGDVLYIPDTSIGDSVTSPYNSLNVGYWVVLSKDGTSSTLQLARPSGSAFSGYSQTVAGISITNSTQQAFSSAGVQVGDSVDVSSGFAAVAQQSYQVVAVNPKWIEVLSTAALPISQTAVPGASGMLFYNGAKRFIHLETDQDCVLQLNGDTGTTQRVTPWLAADPAQVGSYSKTGICWSLTVINRSSQNMNLIIITAE